MIQINFGTDYPFSNDIKNFEKYMFATIPCQAKKQYSFGNDNIYILDKQKEKHIFSMNEIQTRKEALQIFNSILFNDGYDSLNGKYFSIFIIDFFNENGEYELSKLNDLYTYLEKLISNWCIENNRILAIAQHFQQLNRVPHIHIIYTRSRRKKHNELQNYLLSLDSIREIFIE